MKLICAGLSKTGTKSVASALRILGYNVHDAEEHWRYNLSEYADALERNQMPDFARMYANVDAVTDTPACLFWEEIFAAFPDTKVLLMVRDCEEVWMASFTKTISAIVSVNSSMWMVLGTTFTPTGRKWRAVFAGSGRKVGLDPYNPVVRAGVYPKHNARVKSRIPRDQLLVYNTKQGWEPLCEFLGVEIPDVPFPHLNAKSESINKIILSSHVYERMSRELYIILGFICVICAVLIYYIF